jgi:hypothetical protein
MKAGDIARRVSFVTPDTLAGEIAVRFKNAADAHTFPVVRNMRPVGVITRDRLNDLRKSGGLWERRPASLFMNTAPIVICETLELAEVSGLIAPLSREALFEGIVLVDEAGEYVALAGAFAAPQSPWPSNAIAIFPAWPTGSQRRRKRPMPPPAPNPISSPR